MSDEVYRRTLALLQRESDLQEEIAHVERQLDELRDSGDSGYDSAMSKTFAERLEAFEARQRARRC